jgi:hypothetical protein
MNSADWCGFCSNGLHGTTGVPRTFDPYDRDVTLPLPKGHWDYPHLNARIKYTTKVDGVGSTVAHLYCIDVPTGVKQPTVVMATLGGRAENVTAVEECYAAYGFGMQWGHLTEL